MYQWTLPIFEEESEGFFNAFEKEISYDDKIRYGNILYCLLFYNVVPGQSSVDLPLPFYVGGCLI